MQHGYVTVGLLKVTAQQILMMSVIRCLCLTGQDLTVFFSCSKSVWNSPAERRDHGGLIVEEFVEVDVAENTSKSYSNRSNRTFKCSALQQKHHDSVWEESESDSNFLSKPNYPKSNVKTPGHTTGYTTVYYSVLLFTVTLLAWQLMNRRGCCCRKINDICYLTTKSRSQEACDLVGFDEAESALLAAHEWSGSRILLCCRAPNCVNRDWCGSVHNQIHKIKIMIKKICFTDSSHTIILSSNI